jgi:hypothetical protein
VHYAFFARAGFTEAAQAEGERRQACTERSERVTLVPLAQLDGTLRAAADL